MDAEYDYPSSDEVIAWGKKYRELRGEGDRPWDLSMVRSAVTFGADWAREQAQSDDSDAKKALSVLASAMVEERLVKLRRSRLLRLSRKRSADRTNQQVGIAAIACGVYLLGKGLNRWR